MRVFKRSYRDKATGQLMKTPKFYVEFRDHHDEYKRFPATVDEKSTRNVGFFLERLVALRLANALPSGEVMDWLSGLPPTWIERLVDLDLVSRDFMVNYDSLAKHLADYEAWLRNERQRSPKYVIDAVGQPAAIISEAGARLWSHLTTRGIKMALEKIAERNKLSPHTRNAYLGAMKAFCTWMEKHDRAKGSPAKAIDRVYEAPREHRRPFDLDEMIRVVAAAKSGAELCSRDRQKRVRWCMTGPERAALYEVAFRTAARASAAHRLKVIDFALVGDKLTMTIRGKRATKTPTDLILRIDPKTAAVLREMFRGKSPNDAAFNMPDSTETADMLRKDLKAARAKWIAEGTTPEDRVKRAASSFLAAEDEAGRVADFQSIRLTTGTTLAALGTPPAKIARIMGHSSDDVSGKYGSHISADEIQKTLERLPYLEHPELLPPDATEEAT